MAYTYTVAGVVRHSWRRGIDYGAQRLSVVYSPLVPRFHLTSTRPGLASARALWSEPDYWLRLVLALGGTVLGWYSERLWSGFARQGGTFLPGLSRDEPG